MYRLIVLFGLALFLVGCGSGGGGSGGDQPAAAPAPVPAGTVSIKCLGTYNPGNESCVTNLAAPKAAAAVTAPATMNLGTVNRNQQIKTTVSISNTTAALKTVYVVLSTNLDCNGRTQPWDLATMTVKVAPGETNTSIIGYSCGDASPGEHTITPTVYAEIEHTTVLDTVVGTFEILN
jgi:hypothetical protein